MRLLTQFHPNPIYPNKQPQPPRGLFDYAGRAAADSRSTQAQARARTASSSSSASAHKKAHQQEQQRSGMPYPIFQRTAPKQDRISAVLEASCGPGSAGSPDGMGRAPPVTSNSNLEAAAVVRVAGEEEEEGTGKGRGRQPSIGSSTGSFRQVGWWLASRERNSTHDTDRKADTDTD